MSPDELLRRLAQTLKHEIAPAVGEAYPKTQAYMASVVLEKDDAPLLMGAYRW